MSGQPHTPAALPPAPIEQKDGWATHLVWMFWSQISCTCQDLNPGTSSLYPHHYTDNTMIPTFILQQWLKFNLCSLQYGTHHYCLKKIDQRFHMVLLSFKKCKNYKQQLSHSAEKYQDTEITMLHWDVSSMKNVVKEKF